MTPEQIAAFTRIHMAGHGPGVKVRFRLKADPATPVGGTARMGSDGPLGEIVQRHPESDTVEFWPSEVLGWAEKAVVGG